MIANVSINFFQPLDIAYAITPYFNKLPSLLKKHNFFSILLSGLVSKSDYFHARKFVLKTLRTLGFGSSRLVAAIHHEAQALVNIFDKCEGVPQPLPGAISICNANVLWQLIVSK